MWWNIVGFNAISGRHLSIQLQVLGLNGAAYQVGRFRYYANRGQDAFSEAAHRLAQQFPGGQLLRIWCQKCREIFLKKKSCRHGNSECNSSIIREWIGLNLMKPLQFTPHVFQLYAAHFLVPSASGFLGGPKEDMAFSYFDTFGGAQLPELGSKVLQLIDRGGDQRWSLGWSLNNMFFFLVCRFHV